MAARHRHPAWSFASAISADTMFGVRRSEGNLSLLDGRRNLGFWSMPNPALELSTIKGFHD
jgi:hypothetical protein